MWDHYWNVGINWDADIEDDGIQVSWVLYDIAGGYLFDYSIPENVVVNINVRFWAANDFDAEQVGEPFFEKDVLVAAGIRNDFGLDGAILIAFEEYVPSVPLDATIDERGASVVGELRLTQSDGSVFAAREENYLAVSGSL